jgi:hypothetical protein
MVYDRQVPSSVPDVTQSPRFPSLQARQKRSVGDMGDLGNYKGVVCDNGTGFVKVGYLSGSAWLVRVRQPTYRLVLVVPNADRSGSRERTSRAQSSLPWWEDPF